MDHEKRVLEVIGDVCGVDPATLSPETQLVADLGIDSARALHLLVKLEDELEVEVSDQEVEEMRTVGNILEFIGRHAAAKG